MRLAAICVAMGGVASAAAVPSAPVVLAANGFTITAAGKPAQTIRFKLPRAQALAAATKLYGKAVAARSQGDCAVDGAQFSVARFKGGLELTFDRGRFTGWTVEAGTLRTARGIGIGSTVAQLRKAYPDVFVDPGDEANGGLGPSFQVEDGPNGFLDGHRMTSKVTSLYAGATCIVS